jgi:hypothetical protein
VRGKHLRSERFKAESENVECIYAFNNKAISGAPITGVNAGKKTVLRETLIEVHEQLQSLLEMAENEQISLQGMYRVQRKEGYAYVSWDVLAFLS